MTEVRIAITRIVQWGGELSRSNRSTSKGSQVSDVIVQGIFREIFNRAPPGGLLAAILTTF